MADTLTLDAPRRSSDGYMKVRARGARAGVYDYRGVEVDPEGKRFAANDVVKVYRSAEEVFAKDSLASFALKPITDDHPSEAVNASNWRDHARGAIVQAGREVANDGDYVGYDLAFMDGPTVTKLDSGKRELSGGYSCDLAFEDGTAPDGTAYQAVQRNIRGNHIALVAKGRAGPNCRIGDAAACESAPTSFLDSLNTQEKPVKTMLIDGLTVDVSNPETAVATINTLMAARDAATGKVNGLETQVATLTTDKATLDAEKVTLTAQLADAKNPAALRDAAKAYANVAGKAKTLGVAVTDAMDEATIMKTVVDAKLGDAAKGWNETQIAASFVALTKDAKATDAGTATFSGSPVSFGDSARAVATSRAGWLADKQGAYRAPVEA